MSQLLKAKIDVACPACGQTMHVSLADVQHGRTVTCPNGHSVTLQQQGRGIQQADKALDDFEKSIKRLNRKLRGR
jgi:hypothetical protein